MIAVAGIAFGGAGCSAQTSGSSGLKPITDKLNITTTVPPAADFVEKSRPQSMDYMPVGVVPPARSVKPRTPDQVKALEAEMEGTRKRHDALGGRKPPATAAAKAKPKSPDSKSSDKKTTAPAQPM
ncbi:hypothetical protein SLNSH_03390 [Alsobacter soli]|uniref:DUF3035 domain-containing protein n=2 Tax=Alsobacter soli TaxID=2109933 RepID=A0A2T1HXE4_9HYPH|nr:hypothetical protein SLNSH_03390 [Alsobacter soli]